MRVRVRVMASVLVLQLLFIVAPSAFAARHRAAAPSIPVTEYEGVIKSAAADSIVVTTSHKADVTFSITTTTIIRHGDTTVDPATLAAGDRVHVKATSADNVNTAVLILVQQTESETGDDDPANAVTANGYVTSVAADSIVVHRAEGTDVTVKVTDGTSIRKHGQTIHLADIKTGDHVEALGTAVDPTTIAALQIEVEDGNPSEGNPHHH
jgi:ribosomal protein S1